MLVFKLSKEHHISCLLYSSVRLQRASCINTQIYKHQGCEELDK